MAMAGRSPACHRPEIARSHGNGGQARLPSPRSQGSYNARLHGNGGQLAGRHLGYYITLSSHYHPRDRASQDIFELSIQEAVKKFELKP